MSFIRCLSNPEGMYVFGSTSGVEFYSGQGWHLSNIGPDREPDRGMIVPYNVFYKACKLAEYVTADEPVEVDGFKIEEQVIYTKTGRLVPNRPFTVASMKRRMSGRAAETMWAIKVSYKGKYVFMWRVTWDYIRSDACRPERHSKPRRKKTKRSVRRKVVTA